MQYLSHFLILGWQSTSVSARYFKDLDDDIDMESDALEEWLITPVIRLERGVDVVAWWSAMLANGHPLAQMALDFLSIPGKCLFSVVVCVNILTLSNSYFN